MMRLFILIIGVMAAAVSQARAPRVDTGQGVVVGSYTGADREVAVYKGVPYATPPIGSRRWKPAEPALRRLEPLIADRFGPDCMQPSTMDVLEEPERDWYYHAPSLTSEDCLYLNVWAPAAPVEKKRPVMVWLHGGGMVQGSASWPLYDGTQLARKGVVMVSLNYRLGIFARFAHPELIAESPERSASNYDLTDILQALEWVRQNIAQFGGDPGNVTVFGESSGSTYVAALLSMPAAKGLFHRAIGQSGGAFYDYWASLDRAEAAALQFATSVASPGLAQLREMTGIELLSLSRQKRYFSDLIVDGHLVPESPCLAFMNGRQLNVPVMVGFNGDEHYRYRPPLPPLPTYREYEELVRTSFNEMGYTNPGIADGFLGLLPKSKWRPALSKRILRGYIVTGWEMESWAAMMKNVSSKAYLYYFNHVPQGVEGAFHTAEVSYVFDNERGAPRYSPNMPSVPPRPSDLSLADAMSDYWVAFATTGVPAVPDRPAWTEYSAGERRHFMEFVDGKAVPSRDFFPEIKHQSICRSLR